MSRIGRMPIAVPANVTVTIADGNVVTVKGPLGTLTETFNTNMKKAIADILVEEGYVKSYQVIEDGKQGVIRVALKYTAGKQKVIRGIRRVSKPGLRKYAGYEDMPKVMNGLGIAIVSTSKGIMTDKKARANKIGGEVLAFVW